MCYLISLLLFFQLPEPSGYVADFAVLLTVDEREQLELKLSKIEKETSIEFAIVTVSSIGNKSAKDYATELGNTWGVGKKSKDNGIVILIAEQEKEIYIATGLVISQTIPSETTQEIVDQYAIPSMKSGYYFEGINKSIDELLIKQNSTVVTNESNWIDWVGGSITILFFLWVLYQGIRTKYEGRRTRTPGMLGQPSDNSDSSGFGGGSFGGDGGGGSFGDGGGGDSGD